MLVWQYLTDRAACNWANRSGESVGMSQDFSSDGSTATNQWCTWLL